MLSQSSANQITNYLTDAELSFCHSIQRSSFHDHQTRITSNQIIQIREHDNRLKEDTHAPSKFEKIASQF